MIIKVVLPMCLLCALLSAGSKVNVQKRAVDSQNSMLAGPVLGYFVNQEGVELRAILGVPGAAWLSEPLSLPDGATKLRLAPRHDWCLVERGGADPAIWDLKTGGVTGLPFAAQASRVVFSPSGIVLAALHDSRTIVIGGLPGEPHVISELPVAAGRVAVSDNGTLAYLDGQGRLIRGSLTIYNDAASFAFLPGSDALVVGDATAGRVAVVETTGETRTVLSTERPEEVWSDESGLILVRSGDKLHQIDLRGGTTTGQDVAFTSAERLRVRGLHLMRTPDGLLLYEGAAEGRISALPGISVPAEEVQ